MPAVPARTCGTPGCSRLSPPEGPSSVLPCGRGRWHGSELRGFPSGKPGSEDRTLARMHIRAARPSASKLSPQQWARLETEPGKGPLVHGFAGDQRWTLGRIKTLIGRLFHVGYTVEGTGKLMRRHGWFCQVPVRQAMERDDEAVAVWKAEVWPEIKHGTRPGHRAEHGPSSGSATLAAGGSASPGWRATGPGTGRTCSTSCARTAAAWASRRGSPGPVTGT